jgi:hypothetical protein
MGEDGAEGVFGFLPHVYTCKSLEGLKSVSVALPWSGRDPSPIVFTKSFRGTSVMKKEKTLFIVNKM